jgi:hypothetical protein
VAFSISNTNTGRMGACFSSDLPEEGGGGGGGGGEMSCLNFLQFIWKKANGLEEPREICRMRHMRIFRNEIKLKYILSFIRILLEQLSHPSYIKLLY